VIGWIGHVNEEVLAALLEAFEKDERGWVREACLFAYSDLGVCPPGGPPPADDHIVHQGGRDPCVRNTFLRWLCDPEDAEAEREIRTLLEEEENYHYRLEMVQSLGRAG